MTQLPAPPAARLRRPSWRDTRLLVGVFLVLASMAVAARVVAAADDTVEVYAAPVTLPAGSPVDVGSLRVVRVRLPDGTADYARPTQPPAAGSVVLRTVAAGELVPAAALGDPGVLGRRPVTLPLPDGVPPGVAVGSRLEVWASPRERDAGTGARYGKVRRIVTDTEVFAVTSNDETLSVGRPALVQVLLPQADVGRVLDALANEDKIALVPVGAAAP